MVAYEFYDDGMDVGRVTPPPLLPPVYLTHSSIGSTSMGGIYGAQTMDGLARPGSSLSGMTGGSGANGDIHTVEHVTRVRLVQFQKNTDEPMVSEWGGVGGGGSISRLFMRRLMGYF